MFAYPLFRAACKPAQWCCIPSTVLHLDRLPAAGPCVIAPTHNSHLEPFVLSLILSGRIRWMARSEFYKYRVTAALMDSLGAFRVKRRGYPRPTLREGLDLLRQGERVGVFPEGGVARRQYSAMRGGPISHGACFLSIYGQAPIIPIAMVGTHAMNRVGTWMPFHHAPVHFAIGQPIDPGPCPARLFDKRQRRYELGEELRTQYQSLYQELLALPGVDDSHDLHPGQADDPDLVAFDPDSAAGVTARREARKAHAIPGRGQLSPANV